MKILSSNVWPVFFRSVSAKTVWAKSFDRTYRHGLLCEYDATLLRNRKASPDKVHKHVRFPSGSHIGRVSVPKVLHKCLIFRPKPQASSCPTSVCFSHVPEVLPAASTQHLHCRSSLVKISLRRGINSSFQISALLGCDTQYTVHRPRVGNGIKICE